MKLIIDIPEEDYNLIKKQIADGITNPLKVRIANGMPIEQEPKTDGDCISRAKAIENIKHAQLNFSVKSEIDFTKYKREVQEIADGILNAQIKALNELPSVQPEQESKTDASWMLGLVQGEWRELK